jgi:CBS domain-containing protein
VKRDAREHSTPVRKSKTERVTLRAAQVMSSVVASCRPDHTLHDAVHLMWERDCGSIPVVDEEGRLLGIVTDRDASMACYTSAQPLHAIQVGWIMTRTIEACAADEILPEIELRMRARRVRRIPVVDQGRLVGIVSLNDIALAAHGAREKASVAETLATISQHRGHGDDIA